MTLHLNFVFSYESFGSRSKHSASLPSTTTWDEARKAAMCCSWQSNFRAIRREWETYCWPGGYPLYYLVKDGGVLCPHCANGHLGRTLDKTDPDFFIVACDANYEHPEMWCDHCAERIKSAYAEDDRAEFVKLVNAVREASEVTLNFTQLDDAKAALDAWVAEHPIFEGMA